MLSDVKYYNVTDLAVIIVNIVNKKKHATSDAMTLTWWSRWPKRRLTLQDSDVNFNFTSHLLRVWGNRVGVRTLRQQDTSAAGHFGNRGILPKCPDTSAALPMCLTDSSAVQPKCLVVCMCNVLSSVDGRYAYVCLPCTFSYCIYSISGVNICSCLS